ncbi:MAG TPA: HAD family hydrolase [Streptosporangiaceae bacterium]|nr:HAD family hydrolase [Streptosporangiaceae bacterium]
MASPVERSVPPTAAFFDLDKTIISRSSTLAFGPPFYRNGLISRGDAVRGTLAQMAFRFGGASHQRMEKIRDRVSQVCRGWPADRVAEVVTRNLHDLIVPLVYAEAQALLTQHRLAGQDVVIVSTSGQEVVAPIGVLLGVSSVIATRMEVTDGRYTGQVEFYAYGEAKAEQVRALAAERGYSLPHCYAYSDSVTDLPMLEVVGNPRAVNPDRALRRIAQQRGWPVLTFGASGTVPSGMLPSAACEPGDQSTSPIGNARPYAAGPIRRRKVSRTDASGHGNRAPTRDQPREASRGTDCPGGR